MSWSVRQTFLSLTAGAGMGGAVEGVSVDWAVDAARKATTETSMQTAIQQLAHGLPGHVHVISKFRYIQAGRLNDLVTKPHARMNRKATMKLNSHR